jgi:hypothetical protein
MASAAPPALPSASLLATAQVTGGSGTDTLISIENLTGSNSADTLTGSSGANSLNGGTGNDTLAGGTGDDTLDGGTGADLLKGGLGNDTYVVDNAGDVVDETPTLDPLLVSTDAAGAQGNSSSWNAQISTDGRYVVFESDAGNLVAGDSNGATDVFVKDLQSGAIQRVSTDAAGVQGNS